MKYNLKKVATVFASALMLGSTAGLALAANYPAPFVSNGAANVAVVVGSASGADDGAAALDIAEDLSSALAGSSGSGAVVDVDSGDAVSIKSGSDNLNLGNALTIVGTLNDEDMENFLASGEYEDIDGEDYDYDQDITMAATQVQYSTSSAYEDKTPTIGLFYEKDADVLTYTIDFGSLNFTDAIGTDLPLMNNLYYVLDYDSTDGLTLLDSSATTTISEGETVTLSVDDKDYEVTLTFVGDAATDYAKFTVNGESLDKIDEGSDEELSDGAYIAVKEVLYSAKESGVSQVEFTIGKGKLVLPPSGEVELNDDRVINVDSTVNSATGTITIDWNTDARTVLTENGDNLVLPGFNTIKLVYNGMNFPSDPEATVLNAEGTIELDTVVKDGAVSIPLVNYDLINTTTGNMTYIGEESDAKLVLGSASTTNSTVSLTDIGDYFVATYIDDDDYVSYVYELSSVKYTSEGKTEVTLSNMASGASSTDDISFADVGRDRTKGELTFVLAAANETTEDVTIYVQGSAVSTKKIATEAGLSIDLSNLVTTTNFSANGFALTFTEQDKDGDFQEGTQFTVTLTKDDDDDNIHVTATNVSTTETKTDDMYEGYVVSDLATKVKWDKTDSDAHDFEIHYNGEEVSADVYVAASSAVSEGSDDPESLGIMTITDEEAADSTKNLIVLGGSCVNSLAADLLGVSAGTCGDASGLVSGQAMIKSYARTGGKVAVLIAGYEKSDTAKAATFAINNDWDSSSVDLKLSTATAATTVLS